MPPAFRRTACMHDVCEYTVYIHMYIPEKLQNESPRIFVHEHVVKSDSKSAAVATLVRYRARA